MVLAYGSGLRISEIIGLYETHSRCCNKPVVMKRVEYTGRKLKKFFCPVCDKQLETKDIIRRYVLLLFYSPLEGYNTVARKKIKKE